MSTFEVKIQQIFIKPHPNADRLELGNIGSPDGWQVVVAKGRFQTGDLCAYIGENAVVPEWVLKKYGYWNEEKNIGMLAGSKGDRVKAVRLREEFSLGIVIPLITFNNEKYTFPHSDIGNPEDNSKWFIEGDDVSCLLGITKYEPPIPTQMAGEVCNVLGYTLNYDIENWKKYPDTFKDGEEVIFTEKLHGTWACISYIPELNNPELPVGNIIVTSKGLSSQGLAFKDNEANKHNLYLTAYRNTIDADGNTIINRLIKYWQPDEPVYILGEIFGPVQDLRYGLTKPDFRVFDVYCGMPGQGYYLQYDHMCELMQAINVKTVPELYRGPFSIEVMNQYTDGMDTISNSHIREGIVMSSNERRAKVKSVSQAYLLRRNKNATEFQ